MANNKTKTLVRFNVQNVKFATPDASGVYGNFTEYGTATKLALQADSAVKKIYGDGRRICAIVNEKSKTGTLTTNNVNNDYEVAMGRKIRTSQGLAEIKQIKNVPHVIYFETCGIGDDGSYPIAKTMLYGVTSLRPAESFDQTTEDINESTFETALEMAGVTLKASDGTTVYKDDKGNEVLVWQMTLTSDDTDFNTFGTTAPVFPKMPATI